MRFDAIAFEQHLARERSLFYADAAPDAASSALRDARRLGAPLVQYDEIGSTNDEALSAARRGAPHGSVFLAEAQSAGRGRRGRSWSSAPGLDLLVSVVLRPSLDPATASRLTLAVGLAVRDAAARWLAEPVSIKWPNDVLVMGRKLAGILVESQLSGPRLDCVVVGLGVNVLSAEFEPALADSATSLALCTPAAGAPALSREQLLAAILIQLERRLLGFELSGLNSLLDELRAHDALLGRQVAVDQTHGVARGIDQAGALVLELSDGQLIRRENGTVRILA